LSEKHATEIEQSDRESANAVKKSNPRRRNKPRYLQKQSKFEPKKKTNCRNCGGEFPHASKCPALGQTCNFCRKLNYFAKVCRSTRGRQNTYNNARRVNNLGKNESEIAYSDTPDSRSDNDYVFGLRKATVNKVQKDQPKMTVKINNSNVDFLIDTVSSINILDENKFKKIGSKPNFLTPIKEYSHMDKIRPQN
jgi:hypothetical protein